MKKEELEKITNEIYSGSALYVRDCDLEEQLFQKYNINAVFMDNIFIDCTPKIGKLIKNTRYYIISNNCKDLSQFEEGTNFGLSVIDKNSCFKILYKEVIDNKQIVILVHIINEYAKALKDVSVDIESEMIEKILYKHSEAMQSDVISELTEEWYKRLELPLGIDNDGNLMSA